MSTNHRTITAMLCGLMIASLLRASAQAVPVEWSRANGGNGHSYEAVRVPAGISWTQARDAAVAAGGYLATLTSSAENAFVFGLVNDPLYWNQEPGGSDLGPWLGGYQTSDDGSHPTANWVWVTGEPWSFTNWDTGEPNNYTGALENYLSLKCRGTSGCRSARWNDLPEIISQFGTMVLAYVIEYNAPTGVPDPGSALRLLPNQPNPFNPRTTIRFDLPVTGNARLAIYDVAGRLIRVLVDGELPAGSHEAVWDGRDSAGRASSSGNYFARLDASSGVRTMKVTLAK